LAFSEGAEDDTQMRLLSFIDDLNDNEKNPSFEELLEEVSTVKTHLELCLSGLSAKSYISEVSDSWRGIYYKKGYKITEKGRQALEMHTKKVKDFMTSLRETYGRKNRDELHKLVTEDRDFLWFGYYKGLISKEEIENIAKALDVNVASLWWHDGRSHTSQVPRNLGWIFGM